MGFIALLWLFLEFSCFRKIFFCLFFTGNAWYGLDSLLWSRESNVWGKTGVCFQKQMILVLDFDERSSSRCLETESRLQGQRGLSTMKPEFDKKKCNHFIFTFRALHGFWKLFCNRKCKFIQEHFKLSPDCQLFILCHN